MNRILVFLLFGALTLHSCAQTTASAKISGELKKWHPITLSFTGPETSESASTNPFTDYRLEVTFTHEKPPTRFPATTPPTAMPPKPVPIPARSGR